LLWGEPGLRQVFGFWFLGARAASAGKIRAEIEAELGSPAVQTFDLSVTGAIHRSRLTRLLFGAYTLARFVQSTIKSAKLRQGMRDLLLTP
jgi:hypothetical protein